MYNLKKRKFKKMISIERHPNLDNWFEVRFAEKVLSQFNSVVAAHAFAKHQAKKNKTTVGKIDITTKNQEK